MREKHLILYDGTCPLCNRAIRVILKEDKKKTFLFTSLQGKTAQTVLFGTPFSIPPYHTLVLVQNYGRTKQKILKEAKATLRIAFLLGGKYAFLGMLSFLPSFFFDLFYRFIAKRRMRLFSKTVKVDPEEYKGRFLP